MASGKGGRGMEKDSERRRLYEGEGVLDVGCAGASMQCRVKCIAQETCLIWR